VPLIPPSPRRSRVLGAAAALTAAVALLAACSSAASSGRSTASASASVNTTTASGSLLVWTDATRQPYAQAYADSHPSVHVTIVTLDMSTLDTKLQLLARTKSKWPDVIFTPNGEGTKLHDTLGYSADLSSYIGAQTKAGFGSTLTACTEGSGLYCLPGDISTQMLWYNATLMKRFGYTVPTTWAQYQALAEKVATEHPGYVVGSCGDGFCPNVYYRSSGCDGETLTGAKEVTVNLTSAACARVTDMLDPLIADGTVAKLSPFDPDFAKLGSANKILMLPGFVWYGALLFQQTFKNPAGEIAAAPQPTWPDGAKGLGAAVGGQWLVSSASANTGSAVNMIEWETTNSANLAGQTTFPAYQPAAAAWAAKAVGTGFYASDPTSVITQARADVTGNLFTPTGFDILTPFANAVAPALKSGKTLSSQIGAWQASVVQGAKDAGYSATS
jgi:ABC-type glycerol-3-phosphate transport system substrate-binding protein